MSSLYPGIYVGSAASPRAVSLQSKKRYASPPPNAPSSIKEDVVSVSPKPRLRPPEPRYKPPQITLDVANSIETVTARIDRLRAACEEHQRKIRASRTSVEHRLFSELPHALSKLNEMDDIAENMTSQIDATINTITPQLNDRLSALVSARRKDVETMRKRTTPWKTFFEQSSDHDEVSSTGRIKRIQGADMTDADELLKIERWAEDVEMYLTSEIASLRQQLARKYKRAGRVKFASLHQSSSPSGWDGYRSPGSRSSDLEPASNVSAIRLTATSVRTFLIVTRSRSGRLLPGAAIELVQAFLESARMTGVLETESQRNGVVQIDGWRTQR